MGAAPALWKKKRTAVAIAAVVAAGGLVTAGVASAQTAHVSGGSTVVWRGSTATPIKHVVVLFDENISFDHYFGTYPNATNTDGVPFHAAKGTPKINGLTPALLNHNPNLFNPQRLTPAEALTCDQNHSYQPEEEAYDNGKMDKFVQFTQADDCTGEYGPNGIVMDYYDGNTVTALWNYAQHYSLNDDSFGTSFGPSTPGALEVTAAQTYGGEAVNSTTLVPIGSGIVTDPNAQGVGTVTGDTDPAFDDCSDTNHTTTGALLEMTGKNIGDDLNSQGISWGWFQGGFAPTTSAGDSSSGYAVCGATHTNIGGATVADYSAHHNPFEYYKSTANPHHTPPKDLAEVGHNGQANHEYDLSWFYKAAAAGDLPSVSYVKAAEYQDGHAGYSDPIDEQHFLVNSINAVEKSPDWKSTAIVVAYDDSDGWYDHVAGPIINGSSTSLDSDTQCQTKPAADGIQGRCGVGPRLPLLVISPYAAQNHVDNTLTDQSSVVKFIEQNWRLPALGGGASDSTAGNLWGMFDFARPNFKELILSQDGSVVPGRGHGHGH